MISVIARHPLGQQYVKRNCESISQAVSSLARSRLELNQFTPKDNATKFAIVRVKSVRHVGDIIHPVEYDMIYGEH